MFDGKMIPFKSKRELENTSQSLENEPAERNSKYKTQFMSLWNNMKYGKIMLILIFWLTVLKYRN